MTDLNCVACNKKLLHRKPEPIKQLCDTKVGPASLKRFLFKQGHSTILEDTSKTMCITQIHHFKPPCCVHGDPDYWLLCGLIRSGTADEILRRRWARGLDMIAGNLRAADEPISTCVGRERSQMRHKNETVTFNCSQ